MTHLRQNITATVRPGDACVYTSQARKDASRLASSGLKPQAEPLLALLAQNPHQASPPFEKPLGSLAAACSRRINIQQRLVYQVLEDIKTVKVIRMWTHCE